MWRLYCKKKQLITCSRKIGTGVHVFLVPYVWWAWLRPCTRRNFVGSLDVLAWEVDLFWSTCHPQNGSIQYAEGGPMPSCVVVMIISVAATFNVWVVCECLWVLTTRNEHLFWYEYSVQEHPELTCVVYVYDYLLFIMFYICFFLCLLFKVHSR